MTTRQEHRVNVLLHAYTANVQLLQASILGQQFIICTQNKCIGDDMRSSHSLPAGAAM